MTLYSFYKLVAKSDTESDIYIGHTKNNLAQRKWKHKHNGGCASKILFEKYGEYGVDIILIHQLELPNKIEARKEERRLIEENKDKCVNLRKAYISPEERREQKIQNKREYRKSNKEKVYEYNKAYCEANKEEVKAYKKAWEEANKEAIKARKKAYYEANKEAIKAKRLQKKNQL